MLQKSQIHDGIISSLLFCPHANVSFLVCPQREEEG